MDLKEIRMLIDLMKKNGISVFKMEREGFKITMKTGSGHVSFTGSAPSQVLPAPVAAVTPVQESAQAAPVGIEIKSPMVGTFYGSSSPEAAPFVSVGQEITPDTVVCIIEAMKVMNEIKAEVAGTVVEVCAENGKPVQFAQTLYRLK